MVGGINGCGIKGAAGIFSYVRRSRHVHFSSRMNRLGTASGAGAFHRPPLYTSSKHLVHPPYLTRAAAVAFVNSDGCLEDGDVGRDGGSGVGLGQGQVM